jgi:hypothetical protein
MLISTKKKPKNSKKFKKKFKKKIKKSDFLSGGCRAPFNPIKLNLVLIGRAYCLLYEYKKLN